MDEIHNYIQTLAGLNENVVLACSEEGPRRHRSSRASKRPSIRGSQSPLSINSNKKNTSYKQAPSLRPKLPLEVLELVLNDLTRWQLVPILQVNRAFYSVGIRLFYRTFVLHQASTCITLFRRLLKNPSLQVYVRTLDLNLASTEYPTGNFYRLLHKVLQRLTALTSLSLDFPKIHSPIWIFDGCTFSLKQFSTSMQCGQPLARFLDSQPSIDNLTLRGFQSDSLASLPYLYADSHILSKIPAGEQFALEPSSLPRLSNFNAIHAGASVVAAVVGGRPVDVVSIPLFSSTAKLSLDALAASSIPLRRLSVISFDPDAPNFIFQELSKRFPKLEALHIVVLLAEFTNEILISAAIYLRRFTHLKYITCVATSPEDSTRSDEHEIAQKWHEQCPTLQTIILPRGRVWFQTHARAEKEHSWSCLED